MRKIVIFIIIGMFLASFVVSNSIVLFSKKSDLNNGQYFFFNDGSHPVLVYDMEHGELYDLANSQLIDNIGQTITTKTPKFQYSENGNLLLAEINSATVSGNTISIYSVSNWKKVFSLDTTQINYQASLLKNNELILYSIQENGSSTANIVLTHYNVNSGASQQVTKAIEYPSDNRHGIIKSVSPDGSKVFILEFSNLYLYDLGNLESPADTQLYAAFQRSYSSLYWSPDSLYIVIQHQNEIAIQYIQIYSMTDHNSNSISSTLLPIWNKDSEIRITRFDGSSKVVLSNAEKVGDNSISGLKIATLDIKSLKTVDTVTFSKIDLTDRAQLQFNQEYLYFSQNDIYVASNKGIDIYVLSIGMFSSLNYISEILLLLGIFGTVFSIIYRYFTGLGKISSIVKVNQTRSTGYESSSKVLTLLNISILKNISLTIIALPSILIFHNELIFDLIYPSFFIDMYLFGSMINYYYPQQRDFNVTELIAIGSLTAFALGTIIVTYLTILNLINTAPIAQAFLIIGLSLSVLIYTFNTSIVKSNQNHQAIEKLPTSTILVLAGLTFSMIIYRLFAPQDFIIDNQASSFVPLTLFFGFLVVLSTWIVGPHGLDMDRESIFYLHRLLPGFLALYLIFSFITPEIFMGEIIAMVFTSLIFYEIKINQYLMTDQFVSSEIAKSEESHDQQIELLVD